MKAVLLSCMILAIFAVDVQNSVWSRHEQQILAQIQNSNWAQFIVNYAELNLQTNGALTDLLNAIEELIKELDDELNTIHQNYSRRTDQHNRDVTRLEQEIQDTEREIFNAHDLIDNVIIPQGERFANQLNQLLENIANNRKSLEEETFQRNKAHDEFEERVAENNEAISAIDECLQLLSFLNNPSLVQIQKVQANLAKLHKKLQKHSVFAPLIRALIEMATDANFADQGALKQIVSAFGELRNALVDQLNQETADEAIAAKTFVERVAQLNKEHSEFQRAVQLKNAEIEANTIKHQQTEEYLDDKNADLASLNGLLQAENDDFAAATDLYNNLVAEYTKELKASNDAYALLTQPSFTEYVKSRGIL